MRLLVISYPDIQVHDKYDHAQPLNQQVFWLTKYLQEKHDTAIICMDGSSEFKDMITSHFGDEKAAFKEIGEMVKWEEYDLIIDFSSQKWSYKIAREKKMKTLYVMHPLYHSYELPPPLKHPCLTGMSNAHAMKVSMDLGVPVKVLPFGYEVGENPPKRDDKGYLLYFGRIVREKGVHELIDLCRRKRYELLIAGEDRSVEQGYVQRVMESCDGEMIRYFGAVDEPTKLRLLAESHALVIPYLTDYDAYVCSTVKAASLLSVPSICINKGAVLEYVVANGFHVENLETFHSLDYDTLPPCDYASVACKPSYEKLEQLIAEAVVNPW